MLQQILERYPRDRTSLVMILQDIQAAEGYLPAPILDELARELRIPRAELYGLATFYTVLSLEPRGRHLVRVCMGTACHVRQAPLILDAAARELGVGDGETTTDREFTLQSVGCVGACAIGPVVEVDTDHHGHMTVTKMGRLLKRLAPAEGADS
jgi:NADH:ubiquinone oxidoreductase subunit E